MVIGTALGFSQWGTVALSVVLAFLFGYSLTSLPLLRAGLALSVVVPIALATDTFSIALMEIVDNAIMLVIPGAMDSGVGDILFWGALAFALVVAGIAAFPLNRWLITRGRGHAVLHNSGHHPNFPTRIVAASPSRRSCSARSCSYRRREPMHGGESASMGAGAPGLAVSENGVTLELDRTELPRGEATTLGFRILGEDGDPVRDFEVEQDKRMHLIVVRRDTQGFQHLHPRMDADGRWSTPITLPEAGSYRVFADFQREGEKATLGADLNVDGPVARSRCRPRPPRPRRAAATTCGSPAGARGPGRRPSSSSRSRATASRSSPSPTSAPAATSSRCARATSPTSTPIPPRTAATASRSRRISRPRAATACSSSSSTAAGSRPPPSRVR